MHCQLIFLTSTFLTRNTFVLSSKLYRSTSELVSRLQLLDELVVLYLPSSLSVGDYVLDADHPLEFLDLDDFST
jgi:hypothetical protein